MYNFTMRHHFRRPQAMFLIMDHCYIVTVGSLGNSNYNPRAGAYTMVYTLGCIAKIYATCFAKNYDKS
jgi:hypothetical protein